MPCVIVGSVTQTRDVAFADVSHVSMSKASGVPSSAVKQMSAFALAGKLMSEYENPGIVALETRTSKGKFVSVVRFAS